ncbi:polymerase [Malaciobacter halophilus]|nr:O-antigen ligase family protein [Malaciobacter halophilus]RYA24898.1 polymerase [Malaciobacter halophilus]
MINIFRTPSQEIKDKITLWLNHLLVIYAFLIPIHNGAKSSLFFTMLVLFLYRRDYWFYLKDAFNNKIVQAFLIFYFLNLLGMVYTDNIEYGKSHMDKVKYLLFPLMFLSFLDVRFAFRIVGAFIFGMLVSEIFSYLIHFDIFPLSFYIQGYEIYEANSRFSPAPFMNHIYHNIGLTLVVAMLLYQLLNKKNISNYIKIGSIVFIVTATINMTFIASRTGYVLYILIVLLVVFLTFRKNIFKILLITLFTLSIIAFSAYTFSDTVNIRIHQTINSINKILKDDNYNSSVGLRIGFTKYSIDVIKENILFGVGTGDHMDKVREKLPLKHEYISRLSSPHNIYIQILLQFGIIGFLIFLYLFYTIFSYTKIEKYKKDIMIIVTSSALIFMLPGNFIGSFELPLFVVFISAMLTKKMYNFNVEDINIKLLFKYLIILVLFLIIGITR